MRACADMKPAHTHRKFAHRGCAVVVISLAKQNHKTVPSVWRVHGCVQRITEKRAETRPISPLCVCGLKVVLVHSSKFPLKRIQCLGKSARTFSNAKQSLCEETGRAFADRIATRAQRAVVRKIRTSYTEKGMVCFSKFRFCFGHVSNDCVCVCVCCNLILPHSPRPSGVAVVVVCAACPLSCCSVDFRHQAWPDERPSLHTHTATHTRRTDVLLVFFAARVVALRTAPQAWF